MRWNFLFPFAAIAFVAILGCGGPNSVVENPATSAKQTESSASAAPTPDPTPREVSGQISDSDLGLEQKPRQQTEAEPATNVVTIESPRILEESYEIVERYDDESIKRRWTVRLYVTFDRSKPWHQQSPGSWIEHGSYEEFYPGGEQRLMQGNFNEGRRHGEWTYWHAVGEVARQGAYDNAQLDGPWQYFREDGTLLRTESYQAHQKQGPWRYYDTDGKTVLREETYQRDEQITNREGEAPAEPR